MFLGHKQQQLEGKLDSGFVCFDTLQEYREFFAAIPEDKWCVFRYQSRDDETICCALGHLKENANGGSWNGKKHPLRFLFKHIVKIDGVNYSVDLASINNNPDYVFVKYGNTPRSRVLAAIDEKLAQGGL